MAEKSGFFNALKSGEVYDRMYDASDFAGYFSKFIGTGVFVDPANSLKVVAKSGLTVTVKSGSAFIEGYWYELTEDMDITLNPNSTQYETKNVICCTLDRSNREVRINKKEGVSSILPVNNGTVHELVLADISLGVGISVITDAVITDRRPDEEYCGFVKGVVEQIDTADLFLQFQSAFLEWFEGVKGSLDEDPATSLAMDIEEVRQKVDSLPAIRSGIELPDNGVGKDGDIYIQIIESEG